MKETQSNKEQKKKAKKTKFYSVNEEEKKLREISSKLKSENSPYLYGMITAGNF